MLPCCGGWSFSVSCTGCFLGWLILRNISFSIPYRHTVYVTVGRWRRDIKSGSLHFKQLGKSPFMQIRRYGDWHKIRLRSSAQSPGLTLRSQCFCKPFSTIGVIWRSHYVNDLTFILRGGENGGGVTGEIAAKPVTAGRDYASHLKTWHHWIVLSRPQQFPSCVCYKTGCF